MKRISIYGAGGHSQVIREIIELEGNLISETFDDAPEKVHFGYKEEIIHKGIRENIKNFSHQDDPVVIAIGNNFQRMEVANMLKCNFGKAIHPYSYISNYSSIGEGTVVIAGVIVNKNSKVGKHVILNTGASIDHDNVIEDYAHISPKAVLCGHVTVGEGTHVGAGAIVIPKIKIGKWCTIGAGSVIIRDVPDFATVVGNPGRIIKIGKPILNV